MSTHFVQIKELMSVSQATTQKEITSETVDQMDPTLFLVPQGRISFLTVL